VFFFYFFLFFHGVSNVGKNSSKNFVFLFFKIACFFSGKGWSYTFSGILYEGKREKFLPATIL